VKRNGETPTDKGPSAPAHWGRPLLMRALSCRGAASAVCAKPGRSRLEPKINEGVVIASWSTGRNRRRRVRHQCARCGTVTVSGSDWPQTILLLPPRLKHQHMPQSADQSRFGRDAPAIFGWFSPRIEKSVLAKTVFRPGTARPTPASGPRSHPAIGAAILFSGGPPRRAGHIVENPAEQTLP